MLAEAILADRLGCNSDPQVSMAFAREVIARLESDFELAEDKVDDWIARRLAATSRDIGAGPRAR